MAANTQFPLLTVGSDITWKASGGTYAITLTSLANAAARQGVKGDLGLYFRQRWSVQLFTAVAVAATAGNLVELYWAGSNSASAGTENPGGANGTDAAYATPGEYKFQLTYIGGLYLSNAAGTAVQQQNFSFFPRFRYGMPIVVNSSGQALSATAGNHEVRFTPLDITTYTTNAG